MGECEALGSCREAAAQVKHDSTGYLCIFVLREMKLTGLKTKSLHKIIRIQIKLSLKAY